VGLWNCPLETRTLGGVESWSEKLHFNRLSGILRSRHTWR
jgi:hypothetical protein